MTHLNSLSTEKYENSEAQKIVNSLDDIKNFLASKNIKKEIIEKMAISFMAKIPAGTVVKLADNMLHIGESVMKLGENIYLSAEKTKALVEQTQTRTMQVLQHNLPAVQPKREIAPINT